MRILIERPDYICSACWEQCVPHMGEQAVFAEAYLKVPFCEHSGYAGKRILPPQLDKICGIVYDSNAWYWLTED